MIAVVVTMEVEIEKFDIRGEGRPNGAVRRPGPGSAF